MVFGIGFSYGVFQEFYGSFVGPLFNYSESKIALIGTISNSLIYLCAIFNKTLMYYMCPRNVMLIGCGLLSLGLILTGFASSYYQFVLCSILQGVGGSILYLPPVICGPVYFDKHRSLAMGFCFLVPVLVRFPLHCLLVTCLKPWDGNGQYEHWD